MGGWDGGGQVQRAEEAGGSDALVMSHHFFVVYYINSLISSLIAPTNSLKVYLLCGAITKPWILTRILTWEEFVEQFRKAHIPTGVIADKHREFLHLKQGGRSVLECNSPFSVCE